jgi:hypothetical protein
MWNRKLLKQDIGKDTQVIKALKVLRGESHQPNFGWRAQRDLKDAKRRATIHHAMAAHLNNKVHLAGTTKEDQLKLIEKVIPQYVLPDPAPATIGTYAVADPSAPSAQLMRTAM